VVGRRDNHEPMADRSWVGNTRDGGRGRAPFAKGRKTLKNPALHFKSLLCT